MVERFKDVLEFHEHLGVLLMFSNASAVVKNQAAIVQAHIDPCLPNLKFV